MSRRLRVLHAIHDFLPRHRAGSEIYAFELARTLAARHDVFVLAAEYDPSVPHGTIRWRAYGGLAVIEVVNNWEFESLDESYSSPRLNAQVRHALDAVQPDVLHVHNLLNLTFDLPRLARERGARSVATLHDYTLVCPSGGQRVHAREAHVCETIDAARCSRCFMESPLYRQMRSAPINRRAVLAIAKGAAKRLPALATFAANRLSGPAVLPGDIARRLAYARHVFDMIDLFVSPSASLADEYGRLGLPRDRVEVSDYGFSPAPRASSPRSEALRIGFVGTLVWHKGVHVLLEAIRSLSGNYEVQIHGDPTVFPDYSRELKALAAGLPVRFAGPFDRMELAEVYGGIDVLVVPSLWPENSPLVVHEAFMHGSVVVGARVGGIPELVRDGVDGFLYEAFSPGELRSSLQRLIDDRELLARLASAAPRVKDIDQDGREWEHRYLRVLGDSCPEA